MRILHLDSGREMRGGQWQVLRLHKALMEAGHESFLLARRSASLIAMAREAGLPCEPLSAAAVALRSRDFDIVHAHDARSHAAAAWFSKAPLVVSRRVAFPVKSGMLSRRKYQAARRYLAVSRFVAGILLRAGIDDSRVDVVYDGVEIPSQSAQGENIITPYTTDPAKGMALADAAAALAGVELRHSRKLEEDLPGAKVMVYVSAAEGLGSGILLAMAYGIPVIASRTGGIPELIEDGVNGILVQNEPDAIAQELRRLTPARCAQMGRHAREAVRQRFTVSHMLESTLASYRKALDA
jgi:hypothetical protein